MGRPILTIVSIFIYAGTKIIAVIIKLRCVFGNKQLFNNIDVINI